MRRNPEPQPKGDNMKQAEQAIKGLKNMAGYDYKKISAWMNENSGTMGRKMKNPDCEFWNFEDGSSLAWKNPGNRKKSAAFFYMHGSEVEYMMGKAA